MAVAGVRSGAGLRPGAAARDGVAPGGADGPRRAPALPAGRRPRPPGRRRPPALSRPPEPARPSAVFAACLVTWITSGLIALGLALTALVLLAMPGAVFDELRRQDPELLASSGADEGQLRVLTLVGCALALAWCATAIVVAIGVFRGRRWGWVGLVVSGVLCAVVSLVLMAGSFALAVPLVASATTTGLLLRSESRAWCRRRPKSRGSVSP